MKKEFNTSWGSLRAPDKKDVLIMIKQLCFHFLIIGYCILKGAGHFILIERGSNIVYCVCLMVKTERKSSDAGVETWLGC
jgi:hypothetical protein